MKTLGDVLRFAGAPERIDFPENERFVTVRLNCGGAVQRNISAGKTPVRFTGYRVRTGQFIYSRIDARNGAFAIVTEDLDGAVVSKDFPVFTILADRASPRYLDHFFRSGRLEKVIRSRSRGATNRQRIKEDEFLSFPIPLPPLEEQRRLAAVLDQLEIIRTARRQSLDLYRKLAQSIFIQMFGDPDRAQETTELGAVADLRGGRNLVADDPSILSPYRVLKISAVTSGEFKPTESKPLPLDYWPPADHFVKQGDLLISRANTTDLVGAVSFVREAPDGLVLPDKIWRFNWNDSRSNAIFYSQLLSTKSVRRKISGLSSGSGGSMKNISKAKLKSMPIPHIPFSEQEAFARRVSRIDKHRALAASDAASFDELLDSLRSRTFRGEL